MQAIEFKATANHHILQLPDSISDGTSMRVLLLIDDDKLSANSHKQKRKPPLELIGSMVFNDDLIDPAVPAEDWNALK